MKPVTLKPGDYVATEGMTEAEYYWVIKAFENAGCLDRYDNANERTKKNYLEWYLDALCATDIVECNARELTVDQVLNASNAGNKETDMQDEWKPEEGKPARLSGGDNTVKVKAIDAERGIAAIQDRYGRIWVVSIVSLVPPLTEEDMAAEEMRSLINNEFKSKGKPSRIELCRFLVSSGYRKVKPDEDTKTFCPMQNSENWEDGDLVKCVIAITSDFTEGQLYKIIVTNTGPKLIVGDHGRRLRLDYTNSKFVWHCRPC